jgi:hypothetical protein
MKVQGIIGAALMAVGGFCPLVRVPVLGNWNYFDLDVSIASVFYLVVVAAFVASLLGKHKLMRTCGWAGLALVLVTLAGVYFKSHDAFSFIHFKKAVNFAAGLVKYKWGWLVILAGTLALITVRDGKMQLQQTRTGTI